MKNDEDYEYNIKHLDYYIPPFPKISDELKALFSHLFQFEDKRYTLDQLAQDPWLQEASN